MNNKISKIIEDGFKYISNKRIFKVDPKYGEAYLVKKNRSYIIAIPFDLKINVYEEFVGFTIFNSYMNEKNKSIPVLCIQTNGQVDEKLFTEIGSDFIDKNNRKTILNNPFQWIDKWNSLFGNAIKNKTIYDVIGEMLVLKYFYKKNKSCVWVGRGGNTHDIVAKEDIYEVKSTTLKTDNYINVNSSYQLSTDKKETLCFVRMEEKPNAEYSINKLEKDLIKLGYNEDELEKCLNSGGYKKGNRLRNKSFDLLSLYTYEVNIKNFPIIGINKINELSPKKNILGYTLKLDLTPIEKKVIFEKSTINKL